MKYPVIILLIPFLVYGCIDKTCKDPLEVYFYPIIYENEIEINNRKFGETIEYLEEVFSVDISYPKELEDYLCDFRFERADWRLVLGFMLRKDIKGKKYGFLEGERTIEIIDIESLNRMPAECWIVDLKDDFQPEKWDQSLIAFHLDDNDGEYVRFIGSRNCLELYIAKQKLFYVLYDLKEFIDIELGHSF